MHKQRSEVKGQGRSSQGVDLAGAKHPVASPHLTLASVEHSLQLALALTVTKIRHISDTPPIIVEPEAHQQKPTHTHAHARTQTHSQTHEMTSTHTRQI